MPKVVKYPWHIGHDYELLKLPFEWSMINDTSRSWAAKQRPLPDHVRLIASQEANDHDLMILHVDQWILGEMEKRSLFEYWRDRFPGPKIAICHGCNMIDGCTSEELRELVGDMMVVTNTPTADKLWAFPKSRFILHGFSPDEWPQTTYSDQKVTVIQAFHGQRHEAVRNNAAVEQAEAAGIELAWVGRDPDLKFEGFDAYRGFLSKSSIFFNPSHASANPRTRTEAMLCGLAIVTTNSHGEDDYIVNGENGFCSNDIDELIEAMTRLQADPQLTRKIGQAGRDTARKAFHIDRFQHEWIEMVNEVRSG